MSFTSTEESLLRQLLDQQAAILSLAGSESTIISKLGATKVTLADLTAASSVGASDLFLTRQGSTEKSSSAGVFKNYVTDSPALTGTPTAPTANQFDNDTSIATTAFVQRAIGSMAGGTEISSNTILTSANIGRIISVGTGTTLTLPLGSTLASGSGIAFMNGGVSNSTIACNVANAVAVNTGTITSITLGSGDFLYLIWDGLFWRVISGTSVMKYSAAFGSSFGTNGYQKLPSGLIIQWGSVAPSAKNSEYDFGNIALPISFNTALAAYATINHDGTSVALVDSFATATLTTSNINIKAGSAAVITWTYGVYWMAIGY